MIFGGTMPVADFPKSEGIYRELFARAPDGMLLVDREGIIKLSNPKAAEMFGYESAEFDGIRVDDLVPEYARSRHSNLRAQFLSEPRMRPMGSGLSLSAKRRDGTHLPVEISLSPITVESELMIVAVIRDVTDRRASEDLIRELTDSLASRVETLELLNTELETFSYSVSHDLRAPLRAIDGFSLAVLEEYTPQLDEEGKDYLNRIRGAAQRMAQLIDDLLELSHVGRFELHRAPVSVTDVATQIIQSLKRSEPGRIVTADVDPELMVDADAALLGILLDNLIGNAWKFSSNQTNAHIWVSGATLGGSPAIQVADNGAGFDPTYAEKIFGPFQRSHAEMDYPGTGIGLAIVQRIVARHSGRIAAEGSPDQGARFTFTLSPATGTEDRFALHSNTSGATPSQGVAT